MALTNPPLFPKATLTVFPVTTGAKTSDTNVTGAVEAFAVPSTGVNFYRLRKVSVKPLGAVATATRQKVYGAKSASLTLLALLRDRLQGVVASYSESLASDEKDFNYGEIDYVDFQPGDKCFVGSGVALAAGFQWIVEVEVY